MALNLIEMRTNVRLDLKDSVTPYRWSDDELNRHIKHAVLDVSQAAPLETKSTGVIIPTPASKDISIAALTGLILIDAVEYPVDQDPKRFRNYALWGTILTLLITDTPTAGAAVNVYYSKAHTIADASSTVPDYLDDLVAVGAAAYAALDWASYAIDQVTIGGDSTPREYLTWAQEKLAFYQKELKRYGRTSKLKIRQLYAEPR